MKKSEELRKQIVEILKKASPNHLRLNELAKQLSIAATSKEYSDLKSAIDYLVQNKEIHKSTRRRYSWKPVGFSNEFKGIIRIVQNRGVIATGDADFPIV